MATVLLYRTGLEQQRNRLIDTAQSQARLIEAVARFDRENSADFPGGGRAATISQIVDAHNQFTVFGETGEFTLAQLEGEQIVFLMSHRHSTLANPEPVSMEKRYWQPMNRLWS